MAEAIKAPPTLPKSAIESKVAFEEAEQGVICLRIFAHTGGGTGNTTACYNPDGPT